MRSIAASLLSVSLLALAAGCASPLDDDDVETDDAALSQQESLVRFYRGWDQKQASVVAEVKRAHGAPVESMNATQYAQFLGTLDLATDDGLMKWGAAAGIQIVALTRSSDFFYYDVHVLPTRVGSSSSYATYSSYRSNFNPTTGRIEIKDAQGKPLETRVAGASAVRRTESRRGLTYNKGYAEDRLDYDALAGYLAPLSAIANRPTIAEGIASMPLFMVKALRGKALYLSTEQGRSYAITMPVSTDTYTLFAGMKPGAFFERNTSTQTPETLVHELCHVMDHTVLKDRYSNILYPYRYPAIAELAAERDALFKPRPSDKQTGYISWYSTTNDQEDFAEHCRAYVREQSRFQSLAETEAQAGKDLLQRKYAFMEKLFQRSADVTRLSASIVDTLGTGTSGGGGTTAPTGCNGNTSCQETACLADLKDVGDVQGLISQVTGIAASCATASEPRRIAKADGSDHYYNADLRCTLASAPDAAKAASFTTDMAARGYHGFRLADATTVTAQTSTRYCSQY